MMKTINPQIFREYDIRGLVGVDLTLDSTELIGIRYPRLSGYRFDPRFHRTYW